MLGKIKLNQGFTAINSGPPQKIVFGFLTMGDEMDTPYYGVNAPK
jgi:hypothetical protein